MKPSTLPVAAFALALAACGSSPSENPSDAATDIALETPAPIAAVQQFVDTVAASDLYESEAGKIAQEKGASQAVKDFGAMMVKDHTASTVALKAAVAEGNTELILTPQLMPEQKTKLEALKSAGSNFDDLYGLQQVEAHEAALKLLKDYAVSGGDAALREFSGKTAITVEHHLEEAKKLP